MIKLKNMKVSIVIPVFNEKNNIGLLVDKIKKHLKSFTHEIIVVDDSSFDGTVKVLKKIEKRNKNLKVIYRDEIIRDLSKSCRDGFEKTKYKNIIVMDGDLQHDPKYLPKMIKLYRKGKFDFIRDPASHHLLFILPFSKIISDGKGEVVGIITSVSLLEMYN